MQGSWDPWSTSKLMGKTVSIMRVCGKQSILRYQSDDIFISFTKCYLWLWADWKQFPKQRKRGGILKDKENVKFSRNGSLFLYKLDDWIWLRLMKKVVMCVYFWMWPKTLELMSELTNLVNCFGHSNHIKLIDF